MAQVKNTNNTGTINYNGKVYKDSQNGYESKIYLLIDCPLCGKEILQLHEYDSTPGHRDSYNCILNKMCDCNLKDYYKEHNKDMHVCC